MKNRLKSASQNILEATNEHPRGEYTYGVAMVGYDVDLSSLISQIDENDIADKGLEDEHHVTLLYGFHMGQKNRDIVDICNQYDFTNVILKSPTCFESDDYDVLKFDIQDETLSQINEELKACFDHTNTHPDYTPHLTIGYIKAGMGQKYIDLFKDFQIEATPILVSSRDVYGSKIIENL